MQPESLKAVASLKPSRMLYMSCYAKTLVRDLKILDELGYKPLFCEPFDMFPRTLHYEVLAYIVPK